jgi:uncharacterized protein YndB with AHSA1/START domain
MGDKVMGVSDDAVREATGRGWDEWFSLLDEAGAKGWDHKRMVAFVAEQGMESAWWQQMVTSSYERERGLKQVGQSADVGFQIGVQRTLPVGREALWELLVSPEGLAAWLGELPEFVLEKGAPYQTAAGVRGELRSVREGQRLRLTWQPPELSAPTTLQVTVSTPQGATNRAALRFHQEKLLDTEHRERMRAHWQSVIEALTALIEP